MVSSSLVDHEIMSSLMSVFVAQKSDDVQFGGSAMSWLGNGAKYPDFCLYSDQHGDPSQRFCGMRSLLDILR